MIKIFQKSENSFAADIESVSSLKDIEDLRIKYFSRNGLVSQLFEKLKEASKEDKPELGKKLNLLRNDLTSQFDTVKEKITASNSNKENIIDLTLPGNEFIIGSKHILNSNT